MELFELSSSLIRQRQSQPQQQPQPQPQQQSQPQPQSQQQQQQIQQQQQVRIKQPQIQSQQQSFKKNQKYLFSIRLLLLCLLIVTGGGISIYSESKILHETSIYQLLFVSTTTTTTITNAEEKRLIEEAKQAKRSNYFFIPNWNTTTSTTAIHGRKAINNIISLEESFYTYTCPNWEKSSAAFLRAVYEYPEETIFPPLAVLKNNNNDNNDTNTINGTTNSTHNIDNNINNNDYWIFPPMDETLIRQAFWKKRILFVGDSTLDILMESLLDVVYGDPISTATTANSDNQQQSQESSTSTLTATTGNTNTIMKHFQNFDPSTSVSFLGYRGVSMDYNCDWDHIWKLIENRNPNVIVFNWGFHMLHLFHQYMNTTTTTTTTATTTQTQNSKEIKLCNIDQWVHYETNFLKQVIHVASGERRQHGIDDDDSDYDSNHRYEDDSGSKTSSSSSSLPSETRLLLFKTNNFICEERNYRSKDITRYIQQRDENFFQTCIRMQQQFVSQNPQDKILLYPDTIKTFQQRQRQQQQQQQQVRKKKTKKKQQQQRQTLENETTNTTILIDPSFRKIHLTRQQMEDYCWNGALNENSSRQLNHRLYQFLKRLQNETNIHQDNNNNTTKNDNSFIFKYNDNLTIAIYNDHDLQSCPYTSKNDGRHYPKLNMQRIRLLAHQINCLYPQET